MSSGLVSVVVPSFNRADCVPATISSILAQTHQDIEILLVDDGSTDGTEALVQELWGNESRLRYFRQPNRGVSAARNRGLREARGTYLALLDSDDTWMPWKLEAQLACLAHYPEAGMIWSDMQAVDVDGRIIELQHLRTFYSAYRWFSLAELFQVARPVAAVMQPPPRELTHAMVYCGDIFSAMFMGNLVHTSTVLLRRTRWERVLAFDESMRTGEDYDFHLRTCAAGPVAFLDAATVRYQCRRADRLSRRDLQLESGRNYLRTLGSMLERHRGRITLPEWMLRASWAEGHEWVGESALLAGQHAEARAHLARSLWLNPVRARTALLLAASLLPPPLARWLRGGWRRIKHPFALSFAAERRP